MVNSGLPGRVCEWPNKLNIITEQFALESRCFLIDFQAWQAKFVALKHCSEHSGSLTVKKAESLLFDRPHQYLL